MTYSKRTIKQARLSAFIHATARRKNKKPSEVFNDYVRYRMIENISFHLGNKGQIIINGSEALRLQKLPLLRHSGADLDIDILCKNNSKNHCAMAYKKAALDLRKEGIIVDLTKSNQEYFEPEKGVNILIVSMPFQKSSKKSKQKDLRGTLNLDIWTNPYIPEDYIKHKMQNPLFPQRKTNILLYPIERSFVDKITPHTDAINRIERGKDLYDAWHILKNYNLDAKKVVQHLEERLINRPPSGEFDPELMFPHPSIKLNNRYKKEMKIPVGDTTPDLYLISNDLRIAIIDILKRGKSPLYIRLDKNAKSRLTLSPHGRPKRRTPSIEQDVKPPTAKEKLKAQSHTTSNLPFKKF